MEEIMTTHASQTPEQRRKNLRLVWLLAGFALFIFLTSFPFWTGLFKIVGNQAAG
jgi:heme/copper-type cytochrome/quinol oxidase subunit 4